MNQPDRRKALIALSSLWLTACGGGAGEAAADLRTPEGSATSNPPSTGGTAPPPAPAPVPPAPVAPPPAAAGPVTLEGTAQYLTWDAGSGPSRQYWSRHLMIPWRNGTGGDWLDANGAPQGPVPYATVLVDTAARVYEFDVTALARRWVGSGENKGAMLRASGSSSSTVTWSGRLGSAPPRLVVTTSAGTFECPCLAFSAWAVSTAAGLDTRVEAKTAIGQPGIVQFDLSAVKGTVLGATLRLHCVTKSSVSTTVAVFEVDAPRIQLGSVGTSARMGLAAAYPGDRGLRGHPQVIRAGDFSDLTKGVVFDSTNFSAENPHEFLPDPDAPGTVMFRGSFTPASRGSATFKAETMRANLLDPLRPPARVEEEMFCRLYVFLEDDWDSTRDANKMAIGWDLRLGWWNDAQGGYWQSTTGNGGAPGTGLKTFAQAVTLGQDRWLYEGHSIRMEAGKAPGDGNPYSHLRPLQSYVYHLDQASGYGDMVRLGNGVIAKGRWHCIEQQIRINSVVGPFDALGNGTAVPDGVLRTWLDGVLVSEVTTLRWRRHPEMGVQGPWINWFYGGKQASEIPMHYRMNHFVLARDYIGPRVA